MDTYTRTTKKFMSNQSVFFTNSKESKWGKKCGLEREIYKTHYQMLSKEDQEDFMDADTEHMSEYDNLRRYDY